MELRHLRYFVAVAEEMHFGRAAERLCIAQPPLSQQIQQLERELGFLLFHRTNRRVQLTEAGRLFLDDAHEILAHLEKSVHAARRVARGEAGWLGIGFVGSATYEFLPRVLAEYRKRYPEVELVLRELASGRQISALRDRRIHVGLTRPPISEHDIISEVIQKEPIVAALPHSNRLARGRTLSLIDLAGEDFILFPRHPKPSFADFLIAACEGSGFRPNIVQEAAEIHTAISLVASGVGITLAPACVGKLAVPGVACRQLTEPDLTSDLAVSWRRGEVPPVVHEFLRVARETAGPEGLAEQANQGPPLHPRNEDLYDAPIPQD